jgi:hypothetical protein
VLDGSQLLRFLFAAGRVVPKMKPMMVPTAVWEKGQLLVGRGRVAGAKKHVLPPINAPILTVPELVAAHALPD